MTTDPGPRPDPLPDPLPDLLPDRESSPVQAAERDRRVPILLAAIALLAITTVLFALMAFAPQLSPVKTEGVRAANTAATQRDVERVASRFGDALYTFSYKTIDADIARIRSDATGGFHNELEKVLGDEDFFRKRIVDSKGQSNGEILGVDLREVSDDTATVRVFVLQSITNDKTEEPRLQPSSVELTLVRTDEAWKIDAVQRLL